jgi:hypothetical protein
VRGLTQLLYCTPGERLLRSAGKFPFLSSSKQVFQVVGPGGKLRLPGVDFPRQGGWHEQPQWVLPQAELQCLIGAMLRSRLTVEAVPLVGQFVVRFPNPATTKQTEVEQR